MIIEALNNELSLKKDSYDKVLLEKKVLENELEIK